MKICSSCHALIDDEAVTCPNCGAAQRHFPNTKPVKHPKRSHAALMLIVPAILVIALMAAILAFALRESDDGAPTTTVATTAKEPETDRLSNMGFFTCPNGNGSFLYTYDNDTLILSGSGILSTTISSSEEGDWTVYLETAKIIEIEGFEEIEAGTFQGSPELKAIQLMPHETDLLVGEYAFADCPKLDQVLILPLGDESDGELYNRSVRLADGVFSGCKALHNVSVSAVSEIGANVFENVQQLEDFSVSNRLVRIESLPHCTNLVLWIDKDGAIDRAIWEKLLKINSEPTVFVGDQLLWDGSQCPIKEE